MGVFCSGVVGSAVGSGVLAVSLLRCCHHVVGAWVIFGRRFSTVLHVHSLAQHPRNTERNNDDGYTCVLAVPCREWLFLGGKRLISG